jgi:hypothetical protein
MARVVVPEVKTSGLHVFTLVINLLYLGSLSYRGEGMAVDGRRAPLMQTTDMLPGAIAFVMG